VSRFQVRKPPFRYDHFKKTQGQYPLLSPTDRCIQRQGQPEINQYTMRHILNRCILTTGTVQHLAVKPVAAHSDLTSAAVAGSFGAVQRVSWIISQIEVHATYESSIPSRRHLRQMSGSTGGYQCPGYDWMRISFDFLRSFGSIPLPNSSLTAL